MESSSIKETIIGKAFSNIPSFEETLVIHDTTQFEPKVRAGEEEFGLMRGKSVKGFFVHTSLLVGLGEKAIIYGVGEVHVWKRAAKKNESTPSEKMRWIEQAQKVQKRGGDKKIIHVMDREADDYTTFSIMAEEDQRYVIRLAYDRQIGTKTDPLKLFEELRNAPIFGERKIELCKRESSIFKKKDAIYPSREAGLINVCISGKAVELPCPGRLVGKKGKRRNEVAEKVKVNIVRVFEKNPREGQKPVEWHLVTQEPIETWEQVLKIVDIYRRRWIIEEYFKALKTGCNLESRLFETYTAWERMLYFFLPIAHTLLNLRNLESLDTDQQVSVITPIQLKILKKLAAKKNKVLTTIKDIQLEIAALGGHIKSNGPPGWIVLARGYTELLSMENGYLLHHDL